MSQPKISVTHMTGQAGVHQIASQLCLRGINPCVPSVDYGADLVTDTGLRLQVKTAHLYTKHMAYVDGAYRFSVRENRSIKNGEIIDRRPRRNWKEICDFFVFWGIEENRFFIIPIGQMPQGTVYIRKKRQQELALRQGVTEMRKSGMSNLEIGVKLGIKPQWVPWLCKPNAKTDKFLVFEDRWDLLDVNKVSSKIVESATPTSVSVEA
jgi:hypothetical protein